MPIGPSSASFVLAIALCGWGGILALAPCARAAAEQEVQLGVHAALGSVVAEGRSTEGAAIGGDLQYGLTDAWALRAGIETGRYAKLGPDRGGVTAANLSAGATYTLDVLRLLPFVEGSLCAMWVGGDVTSPRHDLGIQVGLGAEYLINRRYSVGLLARYAYLPLQLTGSDTFGETPRLATISLRASYRWF